MYKKRNVVLLPFSRGLGVGGGRGASKDTSMGRSKQTSLSKDLVDEWWSISPLFQSSSRQSVHL